MRPNSPPKPQSQPFELPLSPLPFAAPAWLKGGHLQTIYASLQHKPAPLKPGKRLRVEVESGDSVLCYHHQSGAEQAQGCLLLIHGLEGDADSPFIVSTAQKALADGHDVIRMNMRSCGGSAHLSRSAYHGGLSQDVYAVARHAAEQLGYERVVPVGFSLGGHQVLKLMGELGAEAPVWLKGAIAVSPPLDLGATCKRLMRPDNIIYERYFHRRMLRTHRARRRFWPEHVSLAPLARARNLLLFDEHVTAPAFGFADAQDYYQQSSAMPLLPRIAVPTLIILASDDPIIPYACHSHAMGLGNPKLRWLLSAEGGHCGFYNEPGLAAQDRDPHWAENRLLEAAGSWLGAAQDASAAVPEQTAIGR